MKMAHGSLSMDRITVGICQHHDDHKIIFICLIAFMGKKYYCQLIVIFFIGQPTVFYLLTPSQAAINIFIILFKENIPVLMCQFYVAGLGKVFIGRNSNRRHASCTGQDSDVLVLVNLPSSEEKQTKVSAAPASIGRRSK